MVPSKHDLLRESQSFEKKDLVNLFLLDLLLFIHLVTQLEGRVEQLHREIEENLLRTSMLWTDDINQSYTHILE